MNTNTKSVSPWGNILVIMVIIAAVAGAGYFVYTQVADSAVDQNTNQSASDLDIVLEDLNITFGQTRHKSPVDQLKTDLLEIDSLESIEIRI